jgi:hypothetical protein
MLGGDDAGALDVDDSLRFAVVLRPGSGPCTRVRRAFGESDPDRLRIWRTVCTMAAP